MAGNAVLVTIYIPCNAWSESSRYVEASMTNELANRIISSTIRITVITRTFLHGGCWLFTWADSVALPMDLTLRDES
jgi:hypothetical protein